MNITAELQNGYLVTEKSKIAEVVYDKVTKINRIYLNPTNCRPAPGVLEAIREADCIIIGPGSLYTNVIPNLLVNGVAKAIKESTGLKVYISNIMTEPGQTDEYSVSDHLNAIIEHCGKGIVDYCIYDTGEVVPEYIKKYNLEGQDLVDSNVDKVKGITFLQRNLSMITEGCIRHDPELIAESIIGLICDDLKYQDKQNDPQFLMLNNKLREDKRINKIKKQMAKDAKKNKKSNKDKHKRNSKFSNKYSDRIQSIKQADEMIKLKEQKMKKELKKNRTFMFYPATDLKLEAIVNLKKEESDDEGKRYSKNSVVEEAIDYYYNAVVNKNPSFFVRIADSIVSYSLQKNFRKIAKQLNQIQMDQTRQMLLNEKIAQALNIDVDEVYEEADKLITVEIEGDERVG